MIGFSEIALILLVVLILFGAGKLPSVMGDMGKGLRSFKDGFKDDGKTDVVEKKDDTQPPVAPT